jgi:drug/metabolite transporter (DMT)-like permease
MDQIVDRTAPTRPTGVKARRAAVLMLLFAAFCWGSGNIANKTVLTDLDPYATAFARNVIAALALMPFALRELRHRRAVSGWVRSALSPSAFFAAAVILQQWGYQAATVTNASFLVNTACVFTPIIAFFLLRERLHPCIAIAAGLTLVGAFLMSGAGTSLAAMNAGDRACVVSALLYAVWFVTLSSHLAAHGRPWATTLAHCAVTALACLPLWWTLSPPQPGTIIGALPEVLFLGLFSTALAFGLTAVAQAHVSASTAAVLVAAESLFGAAGGIIVLGERPGAGPLMGAALMLIAILIVARTPSPSTFAVKGLAS